MTKTLRSIIFLRLGVGNSSNTSSAMIGIEAIETEIGTETEIATGIEEIEIEAVAIEIVTVDANGTTIIAIITVEKNNFIGLEIRTSL